jgi:hypothetical protein
MYGTEVNTGEDHGQASDMPHSSQSHDGPNTSVSIPNNIHHGMNGARRFFPGLRPIQSRYYIIPCSVLVPSVPYTTLTLPGI